MQYTEELSRVVISKLRAKADDLERDAGFTGSWSDGGAGRLRDAINAFEAGRDGRWPDKEWEQMAQQISHENDPEWHTYQRLKKKFDAV